MVNATFNVLWRDLGCPTEPGNYMFAGKSIQVKQVHVDAAAGEPDAVCTVVEFIPTSGPRSYMLSSIETER